MTKIWKSRKDLLLKVEEILDFSNKNKTERKIGIVGALGTRDLGEEANLLALQKELRFSSHKIELICVTKDPKIASIHTGVKSYPLLDGILRNNIFSVLFRNFGKLESYLFVIPRKIRFINETNNGVFFMRLFYLTFTYIWNYVSKSPLRRLVSSSIRQHIRNMEECDLIIYQDGAYINSWNIKSRIYMYLFPAFVASRSSIPVISSGLNIRPFNTVDKICVKKYFSLFKFLGVRDRTASYNTIREILPSKLNYIIFKNNDAITVQTEQSKLPDNYIGANIKPHRYFALNAHYWMIHPDKWLSAKALFVKALNNLVGNMVWT